MASGNDSAFANSIWVPGEPLDPSQSSMSTQELSDRLLFTERALDGLKVGDLPMAGLMKTLEQTWQPDPSTLFPAGSITSDSLNFTSFYGQVAAAGSIQIAGSGKWTVVRNSAGDYTVTFPALKNIPTVIATPEASVTGFRVNTKTTSTFKINASGDTDFDFLVQGK